MTPKNTQMPNPNPKYKPPGTATKECYGKCRRCVWLYNRGCSEWMGKNKRKDTQEESKKVEKQ